MEYYETEKVEDAFLKDLKEVLFGTYGFHENVLTYKRKWELVREVIKPYIKEISLWEEHMDHMNSD